MTCCRLSLRPCTAPQSYSLQPLLRLLLLSHGLGPSLLQVVSIVSLLLNHGTPIFRPVREFHLFLFYICFSDDNEVPVWYLVVITTAISLLLLPQYSSLAVLGIFNNSDTCAVCNAVGLLILLNFTFRKQLMIKRLWAIYICTCSSMFSIDVVASAPDDSCICW